MQDIFYHALGILSKLFKVLLSEGQMFVTHASMFGSDANTWLQSVRVLGMNVASAGNIFWLDISASIKITRRRELMFLKEFHHFRSFPIGARSWQLKDFYISSSQDGASCFQQALKLIPVFLRPMFIIWSESLGWRTTCARRTEMADYWSRGINTSNDLQGWSAYLKRNRGHLEPWNVAGAGHSTKAKRVAFQTWAFIHG